MSNLQYIGARYVPKFYLNPDYPAPDTRNNDWKSGVDYEALTIVTYNNDSYTSKKPVPDTVGNPIDNPDYWACTTKYTAALMALQTTVGNHETRLDNIELKTDEYVTPEMFGALADGVTDDANAIQLAIDSGKPVVFSNKKYAVKYTLTLKDNTTLLLNQCEIIANIPLAPLFKTIPNNNIGTMGVAVKGNSATISGTCTNIFEFNGSTDFSLSPANYAWQILIDGIKASGSNIDCFIKMNNAVRDVFITNCYAWTKNGIIADGKCVEIMISNCVIFTNANGNPLKLSSALATNKYNEGWTIVNSTFDSTDSASKIYIADVFVFQFINCYVGVEFDFDVPTTTTHTREIILSGNVIAANVKFIAGNAVTNPFHARISNNVIMGTLTVVRGGFIEIDSNAFESAPSGSTYGVILQNNIQYCKITNNSFDSSYSAGGIISNASAISDTSVSNNKYDGAGSYCLYSAVGTIERHNNIGGTNGPFSGINPAVTSVAVGDDIISSSFRAGKGQTGFFTGRINLSSAAAANALLYLNVPSGVSIPSGSGWSSGYIDCRNNDQIVFNIPYYCTADVDGTIKLTNNTGSALAVTYHSWFSITRN